MWRKSNIREGLSRFVFLLYIQAQYKLQHIAGGHNGISPYFWGLVPK
jgi:hypothetical protein